MCGIFGLKVNCVCPELFGEIKYIFESQKLRGMIGCGVALLRDGIIKRVRGVSADTLFESEVFLSVWNNLKIGDIVIAHHRNATTGGSGNCITSNHPLCNEEKTLALVHNGHILNYKDIFKRLKSEGHVFETEIRTITTNNLVLHRDITDSEVFVHLLEGADVVTASLNLKNIEGATAIAFIKRGSSRLYLYRNGNPIEVYNDNHGNFFFSSELHHEKYEFTRIGEINEGVLYAYSNRLKYMVKIRECYPRLPKVTKQEGLYGYSNNPYNHEEVEPWMGGLRWK